MKLWNLALVLLPMISNVEPKPTLDQRLTNIKIDLITLLDKIPEEDVDFSSEDWAKQYESFINHMKKMHAIDCTTYVEKCQEMFRQEEAKKRRQKRLQEEER